MYDTVENGNLSFDLQGNPLLTLILAKITIPTIEMILFLILTLALDITISLKPLLRRGRSCDSGSGI